VVSAGADGRILTWRLTPNGDDVEPKPIEEVVLESPYGPGTPAPRIRALAVAAPGSGGAIGGIPGGGGARCFFVGTAMCDLWWGGARVVQVESVCEKHFVLRLRPKNDEPLSIHSMCASNFNVCSYPVGGERSVSTHRHWRQFRPHQRRGVEPSGTRRMRNRWG